MYSHKKYSPIIGIGFLALAFSSQGHSETTLSDSLKNGDTDLNFRLRYEQVDQDGLDKEGALTLKTRLNYKSGEYKGFQGFLEFDDVTELGEVKYRIAPNDPNNPGTPIIADGEGTEVNQASLSYKFNEDSAAIYGRQRIALDNHRFIGTVGWRQNEQTYDAFVLKSSIIPDAELFAAHINNTNRIFGEGNLVGDVAMSSKVLNVSYKLPIGNLSGYYYAIDSEPTTAQLTAGANFDTWDSNTMGVRFSGSTESSLKFDYLLEYASQSDAGDNPSSYDASYYHIEGGISVSSINFKLGQEVLGSDSTNGYFITPLATLHKFQGWSDKFLNLGKGNVPGGIVDSYLSASSKIAGIKLLAVYHQFAADDDAVAGTENYGSEINFAATKAFKAYSAQIKFSSFSENDDTASLTDTTKVWLTLNAPL